LVGRCSEIRQRRIEKPDKLPSVQPIVLNVREICSSIALNSGVPSELAGITPIMTGAASSWWCCRTASRTSRLIRFLLTALPCFRERNTPQRNDSEGNQITVRLPSRHRRPSLKSLSMASFPLRAHERGSLFCPGNFRGKAFTPLGAAASQHKAAAFGFHPLTKAMIVDEFAVRWLKRSLHVYSL